MKFILIALIISKNCFGQGYIGIGATNNGVQVSAGVLADNVDVQLKYQLPLFSLEVPKVMSFTIGRMILLSNNDADNFSITPSVGYAYLKSKDFTLYDRENKIITVEALKPVLGVEIGKDWWMGRVSVNYTYCNANYLGVSMRCFISRNNNY